MLMVCRPNRISLVIVLDLDRQFFEDDLTQLMIMIDVVHLADIVHVVMPIVIEAHLVVLIMMMIVVGMVVLHHLDLVVQLMITHHHVEVVSMILIVVITRRLIHTSMVMVDHHMTALLPETTHQEMSDMLMTDIVVAATGKSIFPNRLCEK